MTIVEGWLLRNFGFCNHIIPSPEIGAKWMIFYLEPGTIHTLFIIRNRTFLI